MTNASTLARRYRTSVKALPPAPATKPQFPGQNSAHDHGRTLAGCGYTLAQAMAIHSGAADYDPAAMLAGYDAFTVESGQFIWKAA